MDTGGASLLRQPADGGFHIGGRRHHQVSQLVDDDNHLRQGGMLIVPRRYLIVTSQVPHAHFLDQLKATLHFRDRRVQRPRRLLGIGDNGAVQVRNIPVHTEFDLLGSTRISLTSSGVAL